MRTSEAAKFTPPALDAVLMRSRLIEALRTAGASARWLAAPSGAGKSTLVASYAAQAGTPLLWYAIDERDVDPAFFFAAFARRAGAALGLRDFPVFSTAERRDERAFARRFFRRLSVAHRPALVVFDDLELAACAAVAQRLAELVEACHPPLEVIFISELPPSIELFEQIATRRLTVCSIDLRFEAPECAQLAGRLGLADRRGDELAALTGGHAGALVIACELLRSKTLTQAQRSAVAEQMHRYLLGKLMERLGADQLAALLTASLLPHPTAALLERLGQHPRPAAMIDAMANQGLLIRHTLDGSVAYEMHTLVRRGVLLNALEVLGARRVNELQRRCAALLEEELLLADAFDVWLDAGDPAAALRVLERLAATFARTRQATRLQQAIARLPLTQVAACPWLCFWIGHTLLGVEQDEARQWFARGFGAFEAAADQTGMLLTAASALIVFNATGERLSECETWLSRFRALRKNTPSAAPIAQRAVYLLGIVCEAVLADTNTLQWDKVRAALDEVVTLTGDATQWPSADLQIEAARTAIEFEHEVGTLERALHYVHATERLALESDASPVMRARWWFAVARLRLAAGDPQGSRAAAAVIDELVQRHDLHRLVVSGSRFHIEIALRTGALREAARLLAQLESRLANATAVDVAEVTRLGVRVLLANDRKQEALARAQGSLEAARRAGVDGAHATRFEVDFASALVANERAAEGARRLRDIVPLLAPGATRAGVLGMARCLDFIASDGTDLAALTEGLAHVRAGDFHDLLRDVPRVGAALCQAALDHGIETEFVQRLIRIQGLVPPPGAGPQWPWAVRVWTLGGFRLEIDGDPYRPAHKAQDKPLDLLKLLLAAQAAGRVAPDKAWLAEQLWPDAEADNARKSLDMAVARLRRLLGNDECVEAGEGRLQLSPRHVWTDLRPLLTALAQFQAQRDAVTRGATAEPLRRAVNDLLAAYPGEFLSGEDEAPWAVGARAHLSRAFRAALLSGADALRGTPDPQFIQALERALLADPGAEELARALMRAHLARGDYAEAMRVYRSCRDALSSLLGVRPGAATEEIRAQVQRAAQASEAAPAVGTMWPASAPPPGQVPTRS